MMFFVRYWAFFCLVIVYVFNNMVMLTDNGQLYRWLKEKDLQEEVYCKYESLTVKNKIVDCALACNSDNECEHFVLESETKCKLCRKLNLKSESIASYFGRYKIYQKITFRGKMHLYILHSWS